MDIKEKIEISANPTKLTLFKEGMFYKCYNEDAMVFYKNIKEYKISSKYIKALKSTVLSLGFPKSAWNASTLTLELSNQLGLGEAIEHETFIEYHLNVEGKSGFATHDQQKQSLGLVGWFAKPLYAAEVASFRQLNAGESLLLT